MGLYDREYMREDEPGYRHVRSNPWSPTVALLIVLGAVFVIQFALQLKGSHWLDAHGALSLEGIRAGRIWQLVTFQFLHGNLLHLALNGMTLYSFGRFLEQDLGRGRFLALYFISGTAGGLLQVVATWLLRQDPAIPVVGASAGISGLLGAFILSHPEVRLMMFPIPFKFRAWSLLWIVLPLSVIGTVFPFGGIAHAAHLGGLLAGGAFTRWTWTARRNLFPPVALDRTPEDEGLKAAEKRTDEFIASEVDPILEKIHAHGIHSLTEREREILAKARSKIGQR